MQSDALMRLSTVLIAPTSTAARDVSRLGDHCGRLELEEQLGVDLALGTVLDLQ